jgi:phosphoglycolate phosphatase
MLVCLRRTIDESGLPMPDDAVLQTFLGPPLYVSFQRVFDVDEPTALTLITRYRSYYHGDGERLSTIFAGMPDALDRLAATGHRLAVATSKPTESATRILEHHELTDRFAFIAGAELTGPRQHKADVIAHALEALNVTPGSDSDALIMVGDREHDVHGAARFGIPTIGVLWGYGDADELTAAGARALAAEPREIVDLVTALIAHPTPAAHQD